MAIAAWTVMKIDEKKYVDTWASLLKDTPNIKEHLMKQKKNNPNNWRPWVLKLIRLFKG